MLSLDDRCAIVTGGSSGIGRAVSLTFAEQGADVVVADIQEVPREGGRPTRELIEDETDGDAVFTECDVTDRDDLEAMVEIADTFGGVDVLVNNAGVLERKPFLEFTEAEYDRIMDVNVKGTFFSSQVAIERMLASGGGSIINLSSVSGLEGSDGKAAYSASKSAIRLLTYSLAAEFGPDGLRVNAILPGAIETMQSKEDSGTIESDRAEGYLERIPARRFGDPGDVANAALFLASDASSYVNGSALLVDGGRFNTG